MDKYGSEVDNDCIIIFESSTVAPVLSNTQASSSHKSSNRASSQHASAKNKEQLSKALEEGNHVKVKFLLENESCSNHFGPISMSALHIAASHGHLKTCQVLLKFSISPNIINKVSKTPLHLASQKGHFEVAELLLSSGAAIDPYDMLGMTPLHWACEEGHVSIVHLLMTHGANPHLTNKFMKTPILLAKEKEFDKILLLLEGIYQRTSHNSSTTKHTFSSHIDDSTFGGADEALDRLSQAFNEIPSKFAKNLDEKTLLPERMDEDDDLDESFGLPHMNKADSPSSFSSGDEGYRAQHYLLDSLISMAENSKESLILDPKLSKEKADLLRYQASLGTLEDPSMMLLRALDNGHTLCITEAGHRALSMITPDSWAFPTRRKRESLGDDDTTEKRKVSSVNIKENSEHAPSSALIPCNPDLMSPQAAFNYLQDYVDSLKDSITTPPSPPLKKPKHKI